MNKLGPTLWLLLAGLHLSAQLPATKVFLFDMRQVTDSLFLFSKPKYLSAFNPQGYNNQPSFIDANTIYITVQSPETGEQTDIFALDLLRNVKTRVTATIESEYSPLAHPDGRQFTCVRVESDVAQTQRLWRFPIDRKNQGEPAFVNITDVGYHHWINRREAALFIVADPHRLIIANTENGTSRHVMTNIGRCFGQMPNGNLAFVHKISNNFWQIRQLNLSNMTSEAVVTTPENSEDFVILRDGTIIMGKGSKLFKFNKAIDNSWLEIADLSFYNIRNISRLAVSSGNKIAIVSD